MRIPSGIFWGCKIDEILTLLSFCPWLSVWYCLFGFLLKSSEPQLQVYHYLTIWLQIWYHSLLWRDSIRKGVDLEKQSWLLATPRNWGNKFFISFFDMFFIGLQSCRLGFWHLAFFENLIIPQMGPTNFSQNSLFVSKRPPLLSLSGVPTVSCSRFVFSPRFRRKTLLQWVVFFVSSTRSVHFLCIMHFYHIT